MTSFGANVNGTFANASYEGRYYNDMDSTKDKRSTFVICFEAGLLCAIIVTAIIGNSLILTAIYRFRSLQTKTNVFVVNLAIADISLAVLAMPFTMTSSITYEWIFGDTFCKVQGIFNSLFCEASILTLTFVSLERFIAILHPLKYQQWMTPRTIKIMVVYIWLQSLICATSTFLFSKFEFLKFEHICTVDWSYSIGYTFFFVVTFFFLPFAAMAVCYFVILRKALEQRRKIASITVGEIRGQSNEEQRKTKQEHKATIMIAIVVGTFSACWFPHAVGIFCLVSGNCEWPDSYFIATTWLAMLNSALNSGIYGLMNSSFKRAFKSILLRDRFVTDANIVTVIGKRTQGVSRAFGNE
ncbi:G-protein coupled receptor 161 [Nematostella vectensis]|uniref:G-protein coupled receptor 161 n=1 Tax=Nematostella vectensis TaxID=45351 RepID=UPI002076F31A|nr:G-protein coupled receptor 161 [Nematostella vectensis]